MTMYCVLLSVVVLMCTVAVVKNVGNRRRYYENGTSVTCLGIVCPLGEIFVPCTHSMGDGRHDTCEPCPSDRPRTLNSFDSSQFEYPPVYFVCKSVLERCKCAEEAELVNPLNCNKTLEPICKCNTTAGYYGHDPKACKLSESELCKLPGYELKQDGSCEECPRDTYKSTDQFGRCLPQPRCQRRLVVDDPGDGARRRTCKLSVTLPPPDRRSTSRESTSATGINNSTPSYSTSNVTASTNQTSPLLDSTNFEWIYKYLVPVVVVVLLIVGVLICVIRKKKRKRKKWQQDKRHQKNGDCDGLIENGMGNNNALHSVNINQQGNSGDSHKSSCVFKMFKRMICAKTYGSSKGYEQVKTTTMNEEKNIVDGDKTPAKVNGDQTSNIVYVDEIKEEVNSNEITDKGNSDEIADNMDVYETDAKKNSDETDAKINGHETDAKINGDETDAKINGHETDAKINGHETDAKINGDETDAKVNGDEADAKINGHETDATINGDETDANINGHETDATINGHETDAKINGDETDAKINGHETDATINDHETDAKISGDETDAKINGDETDAKVNGDETDAKINGHETDATINGDETDAKINGHETDAKINDHETDAKISGDETDAKISGDETDAKVNGDDHERVEMVNADETVEMVNGEVMTEIENCENISTKSLTENHDTSYGRLDVNSLFSAGKTSSGFVNDMYILKWSPRDDSSSQGFIECTDPSGNQFKSMTINNGSQGMILLKMKEITKGYNFIFVSSSENGQIESFVEVIVKPVTRTSDLSSLLKSGLSTIDFRSFEVVQNRPKEDLSFPRYQDGSLDQPNHMPLPHSQGQADSGISDTTPAECSSQEGGSIPHLSISSLNQDFDNDGK